jgi:uncharacterized membrane protein YvbJ
MVYCERCGTENDENAEMCKNCGASLIRYHPTYRRRDRDWGEDLCFGGRSKSTWPLIIGLFIILIGVSNLLEDQYYWARWDNLWPFFIIIIGLIIITNAMQRR